MPHRNNIAGSSLRRNRKKIPKHEKKHENRGIFHAPKARAACRFFVRRSNTFCAIS
jgi:hypothetical protein